MNGLYYTLRWKGTSRQSDENLAASDNPVRIGQRADCEVRLPNRGPYADELFAVIRPVKSADGWQIIPASEFIQTLVNGSPVVLTHYLKDGDHISFSETDSEISFEVRKGDQFGNQTVHFTSLSRRITAIWSCTAILVTCLVLYAVLAGTFDQGRNRRALKSADESVLQLMVDSIYYVRTVDGRSDTLRRRAASDNRGMVLNGTAFLTSDGILVTARHCIEPWLNYKQIFASGIDISRLPTGTAWALEAETYNQTHDNDTSFAVISLCSLSKKDGTSAGRYLSSAFKTDRSRDEIVELGDYYHSWFWRSITGRFNRNDMMLGDIAILPGQARGSIVIPSGELMEKKLHADVHLSFKGYPKRLEAGIESAQGTLLRDYAPGHMLSHNGGLEAGYSGGPALVVQKGKVYAVGVISTFDKDSQVCIYSVPITEIHP